MKKFCLSLSYVFLCLITAYADNTISLKDIRIERSTALVVLPIQLTNENSITGFQCDLTLPSGVTVATDEYGDYLIELARTTSKRHTISSSVQPDGSLRILCTSMTNATFSGNSGTVLNVTIAIPENITAGTYNIYMKNIVLSDPEANRYITSDVTTKLTISEVKKITIKANNITMEYGNEVPKLTYKSEGAELTGTPILSCSANSMSPVGTYPIIISRGSVKNENIVLENGLLTIVKAPLTISAGNYTKKQGEDNPTFTATYTGFKNDETDSVLTKQPLFTTDVVSSTAVGQYPVKVSGAEAQNYKISYIDGTLTVTEADKVTITANNITMVYGDSVPELTYTSVGAELVGIPKLSCSVTSHSSVGTYPITINKGSVENYNIDYVDGTLTVIKAPLTVIAENKERLYFEKNPEFTYNCEGLRNDDTKKAITTQPIFVCDAKQTSAAGEYEICLSGAVAQNYTLKYQGATLTINKRPIEVKVNDCTRVYNEENPEFTVTYYGFVNNDNERALQVTPSLFCAANRTTDVGNYEITASGAEAVNYQFKYTNGTLTIEKATQEIIWEQNLEEVEIGDQVVMTAFATSGLDVEYEIADNKIASIYEVANKIYLDCYGVGQVIVRAIQLGNKNYHSAVRFSKKLIITDPSSIENITKCTNDTHIYNMKGERITCNRRELPKGIYIQNSKKFIVK